MELPNYPRIPEYYKDQQILVTGATGFMGKILVEKLLRSCPELGKIYIVVRGKKDRRPRERWEEQTKNIAFDRLKRERPGILENKVEVLDGDMTKLRLGLNDKDYTMLQNCVTHIFHAAASVRFDDCLPDAVLLNTRGTLETVKLAVGAKKFKVFTHISTAYSNCTLDCTLEEKVYPPPEDWRKIIKAAEKLDKTELTILQQKIIGKYPNTYTLTKNLSEALINDFRNKIQAVILRPSIDIEQCVTVISCQTEPLAGWTDNFNGPVGLSVAIGKGILRTTLAKGTASLNFITVDVATQAIIIAPWLKSNSPTTDEVTVYNLSCPQKCVQNIDVRGMGTLVVKHVPFHTSLWYPTGKNTFTTNKFWFKINSIVLHLLPSILVDKLLAILEKKPINLRKLQGIIHHSVVSLFPFTKKDWDFPNENVVRLQKSVLPEDREDFGLDFVKEDFLRLIISVSSVVSSSLFKEPDTEENWERAQRLLKRLYWLNISVKSLFFSFAAWASSRLLLQQDCF